MVNDINELVCKKVSTLLLISALMFTIAGIEVAWGFDKDNNAGQQYLKNTEEEKKHVNQFLRKRIAVARIDDGTLVNGSSFGKLKTVRTKQENGTYTQKSIVVQNDDKQKQSEIGPVMNDFTERLITSLFETDNFIVLEREEIHKILREQDFQKKGRVSKKTIAKSGKIYGVQYLISGAIFKASGDEKDIRKEDKKGLQFPNSDISVKKDRDKISDVSNFPGSNVSNEEKKSNKIKRNVEDEEGIYALHLRVYDVATSKIVAATRIVGESQWGLISGAVQNITKILDKEPWNGKITNVANNKIYFTGGENIGMTSGRILTVAKKGKPINDPDKGVILGYVKNNVGKIKVVQVKQKYSIAKVISKNKSLKSSESLKLKKGDFVVDKK